MKVRIVLLLIAAALVALGVWSIFRRDAHPVPPARAPTTKTPPPPVTIQDGKTLDFSSGKPVVKDSPADRAALAKGVAEMEAAAASVTFAPSAKATTTTTTTAAGTASDSTKK